jgi:hexosaminidase
MAAQLALLLLPLAAGVATADPSGVAIVPRPVSIESRDGQFVLRADSVLVADRSGAGEAHRLADALAPALGGAPEVLVTRRVGAVRRRRRLCAKRPRDPGACRSWVRFARAGRKRVPPEGYELDVRAGVATIRASEAAGLFYGAESLRQLLPPAVLAGAPATEELAAPCVRVTDAPRFAWRGAMLDVGRHFMPKAVVKKLLDLMGLHKLNRFHWHLTDDQGWRLEILRYPRLTSVGSMRAESPVRFLPHGAFLNFAVNGNFGLGTPVLDGVPQGGFYTQDDVREIVAYAAERHITIVPEIDMPGHITSAIAAYPELGNTGVPIPVSTTVGIHDDILNVEDGTFAFLEGVFDEVLALFPGEFVHVGGDEVPMVQWEQSASAQARMTALGLGDESELATYFTNRVSAFLEGRGRRVIAWNDALRDGLADGTAIMSWFGPQPGIAAAKTGRDVVMAPLGNTYFDYPNAWPLPPDEQALLEATAPNPAGLTFFVTTIEEAYGFEPVPPELTADEAQHVLGGQGQLWTEWIFEGREVERQGFPRLAALAEAVWTPADRRDYADFAARLTTHLARLAALDVCYFGSAAAGCP